MNKEEERVLHGLYFDREMVDEEAVVTGSEVLWLARHTFRAGNTWRKDGKLQTLDKSQQSGETAFRAVTAEQTRPLRYLHNSGMIQYKTKSNMLFIHVTAAGADRARQLHTPWGRLNLWYQEQKTGLIGLVVTVVVALITSLLTNWATHNPDQQKGPNASTVAPSGVRH